MQLSTYLATQKRLGGPTLSDLARRMGIRPSRLHDIKTGRRRASLEIAVNLEKLTGGAVKPADLVLTTDDCPLTTDQEGSSHAA